MPSDHLNAAVPASFCAQLVAWIDQAMSHLRHLGLGTTDLGRLPDARRILHDVSLRGTYGSYAGGSEALNAIRLATDLHQIWLTIGEDSVIDLLGEIRLALKGTLKESGDRRPYQAQSQIFAGSLLAISGLDVAARPPSRPGPDFVVTPMLLTLDIEVKRPESAKTILRNLKDAVKKLDEARTRGLILLDLSDALLPSGLIGRTQSWDTDPREGLVSRWSEITRPIYEAVRNPPAQFRDITRVVAAFAFARGARWVTTPSGEVLPELYSLHWIDANPHRGKTVWYWRGIGLLDSVKEGFAQIGAVELEPSR